MTARARKVFESLPRKVVQQIERLARSLKETPESIVERAVQLFDEQHQTSEVRKSGLTKAAHPLDDPKTSAEFKRIMSEIGTRASAALTPEEKKARAEAGGEGRAKSLSAKRRSEIARKAAEALWKKRRGEKPDAGD